jgi:cephalosporin-C deacetylase-like acetyl esterase
LAGIQKVVRTPHPAGKRCIWVYRVVVLYLRAYVPIDRVTEVVVSLGEIDEVRHIVRMGSSAGGDFELISADVGSRSGDEVLELLAGSA